MAVPTRDARGRVTGVLAAALHAPAVRDHEGLARSRRRRASPSSTATAARSWAAPRGRATRRSSHRCAARASSPTRAGSTDRTDHAIAYTTSAIPGWTIVVDQPRSVLFADARRGLFLELALVAAAASIVLFLIGFILLRGRREAERERTRARQRRELSRILGSASLGSEVSDGLVAGLADAFPGALCVVALERRGSPRPRAHRLCRGRVPVERRTPSTSSVAQAATLAFDSGTAIVIGKEPDLRATLPGVHKALLGAAHSFYATPLVTPQRQPPGRALPAVRAHASARRERAGAGRLVRRAGGAGARPHDGVRARARGRRAPAAQPALGPAARRSRASS